jgi:phage terminase small subunit
MPLNSRQERFAQNLVANGMNATAAYRAAGYAGKTEATARAGASELLTNPNVAARISELQQLAAKRHAKTVDTIMADLDQLRDLAIENGQTAAGVAAVMGAAKILGFITDRQQIEAVVHRPAPGPGTEKGMILSEAEWEQQVRRQ